MVSQAVAIRVEWDRKEHIRGTLQSHSEMVRAEPREWQWAGEKGTDGRDVFKGR